MWTSNLLSLIVALTIQTIYGKDASYTCCFGDECPLPAFQTFQGSNKDLLDLYKLKCCPHSCSIDGYSYGIDTVQIRGSMESMCVCKCPQSCPIYSTGWTCDGGDYMTDDACPDAHAGAIDLIPGISAQKTNPNRIKGKCTYKLYNNAPNTVTTTTSDGGGTTTTTSGYGTTEKPALKTTESDYAIQRVMNQRCTVSSICVHRSKGYDGTYNKSDQFYNGFPEYVNEWTTIRGKWTSGYYRSLSWSVALVDTGVEVEDIKIWGSNKYDITMISGIKEGVCTPSPTRKPTKEPTFRPTRNPTKKPTNRPTKSPTPKPTIEPSTSPTLRPTAEPTNPTSEPSKSPTPEPTPAPTRSPTVPTVSPTKPPTKPPSLSPSKSPTPEPTPNPTRAPTVPTLSPTQNPSLEPTVSPTRKPTLEPTSSPSQSPTDPTFEPTKSPTNNPTLPTLAPTVPPTGFSAVEQPPDSNSAVAIVLVIIALLMVGAVIGVLWWKNKKKQQTGLNQEYINMSTAANDNAVYYT